MPIAALFKPKAKKWVLGRRNIFKELKQNIPPNEQIIWAHCASVGEFEQGRPVFEQIRKDYPKYKLLLTFFSPSGYEAKKDYKGADWVFYLPVDGARNAKRFLEIVHPSLVIFVKYEFWYYYLKKVKYRNIPLILISAIFRNDDSSLKWYKKIQLIMLTRFDHLFVQDEASKIVMDEHGLSNNTTISGDTRFDRVVAIANEWQPIPEIEDFLGKNRAIIAGSTWPEDEAVLLKLQSQLSIKSLKLIIAPHEIENKNIDLLINQFPQAIKFSDWRKSRRYEYNYQTLIIDNIGMLSRLYYYGFINYVGGGMRALGVHNVLEAAVYGKPVIYGKYYQRYAEAINLIDSGGAKSFDTEDELNKIILRFMTDKHFYYTTSNNAKEFVHQNTGATAKILSFIQEKRLLTN